MAREKICGIYKIQNSINGKVYIGSSKDIYRRWSDHKSSLKRNAHHSYKLQRAWNKYGADNFTFDIIQIVEDVCNLKNLEQTCLDSYKSYDFNYGYNVSVLTDGGHSFPAEYQDLLDGKFKISSVQFDEIIYYLSNTKLSIPKISNITGVNKSAIYQIYYKENYTNLVKDLKFIKRMTNGEDSSNSILNETQVGEIVDKLINGKHMIDLARDYNINISTIRDIYSKTTWTHLTKDVDFPKYKKAMGRASKTIAQYDLCDNFIANYNSAREAERITGIGYKLISRVCNGLRRQARGFKWKFVNEVILN